MDPAVAYDTGSYEPILNVYQTLVNYNGSTTATYVPTLATCVPGTVQCTADYGTNLTTYVSGQPIYWTFVIDPQAQFYDAHTGTSWSVYPSDVVFSIARTLGFANLPYPTKNPGWIIAQSLLPTPNAGGTAWDNGIHAGFPGYNFNNTPGDILRSMLVNDSAYCPAIAMDGIHGNGCVTFVANGGGHDWPFFLQLVADNLGASVTPCGWFGYQHAGVPDFPGTNAAFGDGPCLLPGNVTTTTAAGFQSLLTSLNSTAPGPNNATSWDAFEEKAISSPQVQTGVQWSMVGSGPYYGSPSRGIGYQLRVNPAYAQPSGCSGANGLATYTGYCDPAVGAYIGSVNVNWEADDSYGISEYRAGTADFAAIAATDTSTLLQLQGQGKLNIYYAPTISSFFTPINLLYSQANFASDFVSAPTPNLHQAAFSNLGLREFYVHSYPYATVENTIRTVDGIVFTFNAGGPIPKGMGNYYPTNVSYPAGDPDTNPSDVGGAAWWWAQINNPSSQYYDAYVHTSCSAATPCTFPITGLSGDPSDDAALAIWIADIESLTGNALQPFTFDVTFDTVLNDFLVAGGQNPVVSFVGTGWAPDYPDPTDFVAPIAQPESSYTEPDYFAEALGWAAGSGYAANATACGHSTNTTANLDYWAHQATTIGSVGNTFTQQCQGVAYTVATWAMTDAAQLPAGAGRILEYNLITQITNALAMFIWNGQANSVVSAAPWIDGSSVNTNIMIGGGGDQVFYQVRYVPYETALTLKAVGLPASSTWGASVTTSTGQTNLTNTTIGHSGAITLFAPNGTASYVFTAPAGYGVAKVTGPGPHGAKPMYTGFNVTGTGPTTLVVHFGPIETVTFSEQISTPWPGLPGGTTWGVVLMPHGPGGNQTVITQTTTGTSISLNLVHGAHYKFHVTHPAAYKAGGAHKGGLGVPTHAITKNVKFKLFSGNVPFHKSGLPSGDSWTVSVAGNLNLTLTSTKGTIKFALVNGTYTYTVSSSGGTPTPATGTFTVAAPHAVSTIHIVFAPVHVGFGSTPTRQASIVAGHADMVASVTDREAA